MCNSAFGMSVTDPCRETITYDSDVDEWGKASKESFYAQITMYPNMAPREVLDSIELYKDKVKGFKITGAGGGGYLVLINDTPVENALKIRIRRS